MSLIRCLGTTRLPLSYRRFLKGELEDYRRMASKRMSNPWIQDAIPDANGYIHPEDRFKDRWIDKDTFEKIEIPTLCETFAECLKPVFKGRQFHSAMTLVSAERHEDYFDDQIDTVLIIPYQVSTCHFLFVEDEYRQIKANHIYAFNQRRPHGLHYGRGESSEFIGSKPASLICVAFGRLK